MSTSPFRLIISRQLPIDVEAFLRKEAPDLPIDVLYLESPPSRERLLAAVRDADGLIAQLSERIDDALLAAANRLQIVANYAVGYDNVDVEAATKRGVWISNTPDVLTESTADVAFTLLLNVARRTREAERIARTGNFGSWSSTGLLGMELHGATYGVFGLGRIGEASARRAQGFGMNVIYVNRSGRCGLPGATRVTKEELLTRSDVISIHCPLNDETHHAFGSAEFSKMKRSSIIINTARGSIIDEAALIRALEEREIAGAGLDVFEKEPIISQGLLERDNVALLPHIGSATHTTRRRMAEVAVRNVIAICMGKPPPSAVNNVAR